MNDRDVEKLGQLVLPVIEQQVPDRNLSPEAQRITRPPDRPGRFAVVARFENPDGRLLPGMSGTARIHLKRASYLDRSWRVLRHWIQTIFW